MQPPPLGLCIHCQIKLKIKSIKPYTNVFRTYLIKQRMSYKYQMVYINANSIREQENVDNLIEDDSHLLVN